MAEVTIYHNPRCSKSREALQLLRDRDVDLEVVAYLDSRPDREQLVEVCRRLGCRPQELIRTGEAIYQEHYAGRDLDDDQALDALVAHPILLQRPIVLGPRGAVVARPPEKAADVLPD